MDGNIKKGNIITEHLLASLIIFTILNFSLSLLIYNVFKYLYLFSKKII